jgi:succinyl-CoA synthetase beta subunit
VQNWQAWLILEERLELEQLNEQIEAGLQQFQLLPNLKVVIVDIISYPDFCQKRLRVLAITTAVIAHYHPAGQRRTNYPGYPTGKTNLATPILLNPTLPQIIFAS